jgi:enoyl-CoA hydratase
MGRATGRGSLKTAQQGRVVIMTIDRPAVRNALDPPTLIALAGAIDDATSDAGVGAVVLTGAGGQCFSSGMDLSALRSSQEEAGVAVRRFHASMDPYKRLPVVAAVRGMAIGGGFEIMLMCDLAVVSNDAVLGLPEVKRGLVPGGGATLLPARIPLAAALELGLTGEPIDAREARRLGLVNRLSQPENTVQDAIALASIIADQPPATVARISHLMWRTALEGPAASRTAAETLPRTPELQREAAEGIARFLAPKSGR